MSGKKKILAISGSIRQNSVNELILKELQKTWHQEAVIDLCDSIGKLPYFNSGMEAPAVVQEFLKAIETADAVLICTPEYVFSLPGVLKNALEWTVSTVVFSDKPTAFVVASSAGEKAFEALDLVLTTIGAKMEPGWKLHIPGIKSKMDDQGRFTDPATEQQVKQWMGSFVRSLNEPVSSPDTKESMP